jgi:hypothetical protein
MGVLIDVNFRSDLHKGALTVDERVEFFSSLRYAAIWPTAFRVIGRHMRIFFEIGLRSNRRRLSPETVSIRVHVMTSIKIEIFHGIRNIFVLEFLCIEFVRVDVLTWIEIQVLYVVHDVHIIALRVRRGCW